jgi:O-acetylhomoserine/O-acetylserine sulfhydrylase-like pyridoxal-dependent enzyme
MGRNSEVSQKESTKTILAPEDPPETAWRGSTRAVHAGASRQNPYHSLVEPIVQTATYTFKDTADLCAFQEAHMWGLANGRTEYGRYGNPTVQVVEERLAALEGAEKALLFRYGGRHHGAPGDALRRFASGDDR